MLSAEYLRLLSPHHTRGLICTATIPPARNDTSVGPRSSLCSSFVCVVGGNAAEAKTKHLHNTPQVNTLDIAASGEFFVSGGGDKLVKLWHYDEGQCQAVGIGHSGTVTKVAVSPDQRTVLSVGDEGAILIWNVPDKFANT